MTRTVSCCSSCLRRDDCAHLFVFEPEAETLHAKAFWLARNGEVTQRREGCQPGKHCQTVKDQRTWPPGKKWSQTQFHLIWTTSALEPTFLRLRTGDLQDGGALNSAAL